MKPTVGYLTANSLVIYPLKGKEQKILFPEDMVGEQGILKKEEFAHYLSQELAAHVGKDKEIVVVVGNGIIFQNAYPPNAKDIEKVTEKFHASVPLAKDLWLTKKIETETKTYELITHKDYIETIAKAGKISNMNIAGFIPLSLFTDDAHQDTLSLQIVDEIRKSSDLYQATSFEFALPESHEEPEVFEKNTPEFVMKKTSLNKSGVFFFLGLLGIIAISAVGGFFLLQNTLGNSGQVQEEAVPEVTPTPTPLETVAKADLTIQILNGTGTAGQAGEVEALLEDEGFSNIETGNANAEDRQEKTIVAFAGKVGEKELREIIKLLEETFTTVEEKSIDEAEFMIIITTGEEK